MRRPSFVLPGMLALLVSGIASCADKPSETPPRPVASSAPSASSAQVPAEKGPSPKLRLPDNARPTRVSATLTVVPSRDTFEGEMRMDVELRTPVSVLWLEADGLTLGTASANVAGETSNASIVSGHPGFVGLSFDRPLPAGPAKVRISYAGKLSSTEVEGASKQIEGGEPYVFTHFEPLAARRVFPCFDEPSYKVPWQLTLRVKKGDSAVSNTSPIAVEEGADGFTSYRFAETKPLPSYLIAFAVGPFGYVDAGKVGKTPVRIVVPRGKESWARFAAESTKPVLERLESYFGSPYPYDKLDLIAVPMFGGAMENPGLVTYRQSLILSKPGMASTGFRRAFASVNAHELAHQWFGDLVTTAWWDDLWLNEAFATWMTPKIVDGYRPDWGFAANRAAAANGAMRTDSLVSARAIRQPIASEDDIHNAFDGITYQKGAAVIAMFERWVGPEVFQKGVQRYLREHAHGTATARDLLSALSAESGKDVAGPFETFLERPGVPRVETSLTCAASAKLGLSQSRYLPLGSSGATDAAPWKIPVCARFGAGKKVERACTLLEGKEGALALPFCPEWVVPNDEASGYYRTARSPADLAHLVGHLDGTSPAERISLAGDVLASARSEGGNLADFLSLVPALAKDSDVHVVDAALGPVASLRDVPLVDEGNRAAYAAFVRRAFGDRAKKLGLKSKPGEDEETRWIRPSLVEIVADQGEDPTLRAACTKLAKAWISDKDAVEPELQGTVLSVAAAFGDRALFDALVGEAKHAKERVDRDRAIWALGQFREPSLAKAALALMLDPELDARDTVRILWGVARTPAGVPLAFAFLNAEMDALVARLPRDWAAGFPGVGAAFCDERKRAEVEALFRPRASRFVGGPRLLDQALENLHLCHVYRTTQAPRVSAFFAKSK